MDDLINPVYCPQCRKAIPSHADYCIYCGSAASYAARMEQRRLKEIEAHIAEDLRQGRLLQAKQRLAKELIGLPSRSQAALAQSFGHLLQAGITLSQFNNLRLGMTYEQVCNIIGDYGTIVSEAGGTFCHIVMYSWHNPGVFGGNMSVTFVDGSLHTKAQFGLQ